MEFPKPKLELVPFSQEMIDKVRSANERIGTLSDQEARILVGELNQTAIDQGVLGESVELVTDVAVAHKTTFNPKKVQFDTIKIDLLPVSTTVYGTFIGFEEYRVGEEAMLLYKVEKALDERSMSFETISAPVHNSNMNMTVLAVSEARQEAEREIFDNLQILARVEDPKFIQDFKAFLDLIENTDVIQDSFIRELGNLSAWMLSCTEVSEDPELRRAIATILSLLFDKQDIYLLQGHEYMTDPHKSGKNAIAIDIVEVLLPISGIQLITDYTLRKVGLKYLLETEDTLQPALVLIDSHNIERFMPLRHLREIQIASHYDHSCPAAIDRFKKQYMNNGIHL